MSQNDELQIQRCVDDELSAMETRALLRRLDSLENGWKTLACELLEDRGLRKSLAGPQAAQNAALRDESLHQPGVATEVIRGTTVPHKVRTSLRHWWSHPVTSLTLCAAIAFVGGMLIPDMKAQRPGTNSVASGMRTGPSHSSIPQAQNADAGPADSYRVQMQPGGQSFEIPVYSRLHDLVRSDRDHPLVSEKSVRGNGNASQLQWMIVPVDSKRSMLIPVSEDTLDDVQ